MSNATITPSPTLQTPTNDVGVAFSYTPGIGWVIAWLLTGLVTLLQMMLTYIVWDVSSGVSSDPLLRQAWLLVAGSWLVAVVMLWLVWANFVLCQRGELVVYEGRLEFSRRGPFAKHITLPTSEIQTMRLELAKYPLNVPLTIQGVSDRIHLSLQRVRVDGKRLTMPTQDSLCEHPLLACLLTVSEVIVEGRPHLLAKWEQLEC
ncbi:MAG: hypothetical protein AAF708_10310 [Deinococcota bacterium]